MWIGPLVVIGVFVWMAYWTGAERPNPELAACWVLLTSLPWALLWMTAAIGFGWPLRFLLARHARDGLAIQAGAGVALLLFIDSAMGTSGLLQMGGNLGAWTVVIVGALLAGEQFRRWLVRSERVEVVCPWPVWASAPALAVLLLATTVAPGWLWATEFGGYDALSYHLQLPKEWLGVGAVVPFDHNVYSHFPSFMEGAYYHLAVMVGDGIDSVYAAQMLHASMALLAAIVTGRLARRLVGPVGGLIAFCVVLGTPWVVVTGTLAYDEMAMTLMLATGMLVITSERIDPSHEAALLGIIIGAACGAKLTGGGFVALPLLILLLWKHPVRLWPVMAGLFVGFGVIVLAPYLLTNAMDTGNPFFPFLTGLFGTGHWTSEQAATWTAGHQVEGGFMARLAEAVHQFIRFGLGPNPHEGEPWKPQWSILPLLSVLALLTGFTTDGQRSLSLKLLVVLLVQLVFWILFTHVKSRFMLPAVVPMALSLTIVFVWLREISEGLASSPWTRLVIFLVLLGWCVQPMVTYRSERNGNPSAMIDMVGVLSGRELSEADRRGYGAAQSVTVYVNYVLDPEAKLLMVGHATPLYFQRPVEYQTTWDRGPLSRIMREVGESPAGWIEALREAGYTHLLVRPEMLRNWERAGWNDPLITTDRILNAADLFATVEVQYPNGTTLYRLEGPARPDLQR